MFEESSTLSMTRLIQYWGNTLVPMSWWRRGYPLSGDKHWCDRLCCGTRERKNSDDAADDERCEVMCGDGTWFKRSVKLVL